MVRPIRVQYPGALYHVTSRGNRREEIYLSTEDKVLFLTILADTCEKHSWSCQAYCLMSNHYHLLIETPRGNLSKGMQYLNGVYTQKFNRVHGRVGHVFQGRYKAIIVEKDSYLLELSRYIVLNPVRAKMVLQANDWIWSSYLSTCHEVTPPRWLNVSALLTTFSSNKSIAINKYKQFVEDGANKKSPWSHLKNRLYLGSENFVNECLKNTNQKINTTYNLNIDFKEGSLSPPISHYEKTTTERKDAIFQVYKSGHYSMKEIGEYFNLHYSRVSKIVSQLYKIANI